MKLLRKKILLSIGLTCLYGLLTGFSGLVYDPKGYEIRGMIDAPDGTELTLTYNYGGAEVRNIATSLKNEIIFKGIFPEAVICTLTNSQNRQMRIFIAENSKITLRGGVSKLFDLKVSNALQDSLYGLFNAEHGKMSKAFRSEQLATGAETKDTKSSAYLHYQQRMDSVVRKFVTAYPGSSAASLAIIDSYVTNPNRGGAAKMYRLLNYKGKETYYAKRIAQFISAEIRLLPGNQAPDFSLRDISGNNVNLSSFRGKFVYLDFWASWCPPCRAEHPALIQLHKKYGNDSVQFLSVSMDSSDSAWRKAVADDELTWLQLSDLTAMNGQLADIYGIKSLPSSFLLDREGKIIASNLRAEGLAKELIKLIK